MSQRLVLPINEMQITANYKNPLYRTQWGFSHYGMDCIGRDRTVYACGDGEVAACGQDGAALTGERARLGNVIVIIYRDVLCNDGTVRNLTCRMYHMDRISCKAGDRVTKDTVIGLYGNTGRHTSGAHLHIEFDSDIAHPFNAYGISAGGNIINPRELVQKYGLFDSTLNPSRIWFKDYNQSVRGVTPGWYNEEDVGLPALAPQNAAKRKKRKKPTT